MATTPADTSGTVGQTIIDVTSMIEHAVRRCGVMASVITAEQQHWHLLGALLREITHPAGNLFFDIRTVVLMREHGIREIYTADTDFLQFSDIDVINPVRR